MTSSEHMHRIIAKFISAQKLNEMKWKDCSVYFQPKTLHLYTELLTSHELDASLVIRPCVVFYCTRQYLIYWMQHTNLWQCWFQSSDNSVVVRISSFSMHISESMAATDWIASLSTYIIDTRIIHSSSNACCISQEHRITEKQKRLNSRISVEQFTHTLYFSLLTFTIKLHLRNRNFFEILQNNDGPSWSNQRRLSDV